MTAYSLIQGLVEARPLHCRHWCHHWWIMIRWSVITAVSTAVNYNQIREEVEAPQPWRLVFQHVHCMLYCVDQPDCYTTTGSGPVLVVSLVLTFWSSIQYFDTQMRKSFSILSQHASSLLWRSCSHSSASSVLRHCCPALIHPEPNTRHSSSIPPVLQPQCQIYSHTLLNGDEEFCTPASMETGKLTAIQELACSKGIHKDSMWQVS